MEKDRTALELLRQLAQALREAAEVEAEFERKQAEHEARWRKEVGPLLKRREEARKRVRKLEKEIAGLHLQPPLSS